MDNKDVLFHVKVGVKIIIKYGNKSSEWHTIKQNQTFYKKSFLTAKPKMGAKWLPMKILSLFCLFYCILNMLTI